MSQESLDFGAVWLVKDAARDAYKLLNQAVDAIGGPSVAAGACASADVSIDRSDLRRALDRDGRRLAVEHAMAIAAMASRSYAHLASETASAIVRPLGLIVTTPPPRLSDGELRKAYESGELTWRTGR